MLDNSSTHKTPGIRNWLAAQRRSVLHFTPTSSSWLNRVERWFAELTSKKAQACAHRSVRQLNDDIRAWIKTWNDDPKPFIWTKADQILDSDQPRLHPNYRLRTLGNMRLTSTPAGTSDHSAGQRTL